MPGQNLQLDKIADAEDLAEVIPVVFSWNYIPRLPSFIVAQDWTFELPIDANRHAVDPSFRNSFPIYPKAAGLPYHTGLTCARHNRFWRPALKYAAELCELLAADQSYNNANLTRGGTLASIGQRELKKPEGERFVTFAINLFPQADEERMQLIATGILFVVTFDGKSSLPRTTSETPIMRATLRQAKDPAIAAASIEIARSNYCTDYHLCRFMGRSARRIGKQPLYPSPSHHVTSPRAPPPNPYRPGCQFSPPHQPEPIQLTTID